MARMEADRVVISKVAQYLFQMRSRIAQTAPVGNLMKAPDTETSTSAALPNHQGAIDYFNREQMTFMDRYGDWLWLALFASGGVGSGFAWVTQLFARKRRELVDQVLDRLLCILSEARGAKAVASSTSSRSRSTGSSRTRFGMRGGARPNTRTMTALLMAIDSARAAIADRRRDLVADAAGRRTRARRAFPPPRPARRAG